MGPTSQRRSARILRRLRFGRIRHSSSSAGESAIRIAPFYDAGNYPRLHGPASPNPVGTTIETDHLTNRIDGRIPVLSASLGLVSHKEERNTMTRNRWWGSTGTMALLTIVVMALVASS